jgi:hypothetical protein
MIASAIRKPVRRWAGTAVREQKQTAAIRFHAEAALPEKHATLQPTNAFPGACRKHAPEWAGIAEQGQKQDATLIFPARIAQAIPSAQATSASARPKHAMTWAGSAAPAQKTNAAPRSHALCAQQEKHAIIQHTNANASRRLARRWAGTATQGQKQTAIQA